MSDTLSIEINASFLVNNTKYTANMGLPTAVPTGDAPFLFLLTSAPKDTPNKSTTLLTVAVGGSKEVYVSVAPPKDLIEAAVQSDIVQALNVVVAEGDYDTTTNTFKKPAPAPTPKPAA